MFWILRLVTVRCYTSWNDHGYFEVLPARCFRVCASVIDWRAGGTDPLQGIKLPWFIWFVARHVFGVGCDKKLEYLDQNFTTKTVWNEGFLFCWTGCVWRDPDFMYFCRRAGDRLGAGKISVLFGRFWTSGKFAFGWARIGIMTELNNSVSKIDGFSWWTCCVCFFFYFVASQ